MKKYITIIISVIIISIVGYGAYSYYQISNPKGLFDNPPKKEIANNDNSSEEDKPASIEIDPLLEDPFEFSDRVNFLFLGLDANKERYETMGSFRTDTIMLISVDFEENKVDIISIPRDSYVEIPGRRNREKINAAFTRGGGFRGKGFEKAIETVSHFLGGIPIQYYIGVDMNVVKDVVDIMGGIDYDVDVRVKIGKRVIEKGFQHLDGQQVLDYARYRKTARGDIDRIDRQQKIVMAIFNQLKTTEQLLKMPRYYTTVMEKVHTNLDIKQIAGLAFFATKLGLEDIQRHIIPGGFLNMDEISYWGIHEQQKKKMIKDIFGVDIRIDPKNDIDYIKRELQEKERAFKEAIAQSQQIIEDGDKIIADYEGIIKDDEVSRIKDYASQIDHVIEDGDMDSVEKINSEFKQYIDNLKLTLDERNSATQNAHAVIADISAKIEEYRSFLENKEKDALNQKIANLNQAVNSKDTEAINKAIQDLESSSSEVFKECQRRKEEKAEADRSQAIKDAEAIVNSTSKKMKEYDAYLKAEEKAKLEEKMANVNKVKDDKKSSIQTINQAAQDLKAYGDEVFRDCKERRDAEEKDDQGTNESDQEELSESQSKQQLPNQD